VWNARERGLILTAFPTSRQAIFGLKFDAEWVSTLTLAEYFLIGPPKKKFGSPYCPVEYSYDPQGRLKARPLGRTSPVVSNNSDVPILKHLRREQAVADRLGRWLTLAR